MIWKSHVDYFISELVSPKKDEEDHEIEYPPDVSDEIVRGISNRT